MGSGVEEDGVYPARFVGPAGVQADVLLVGFFLGRIDVSPLGPRRGFPASLTRWQTLQLAT